MRRWSRRDSKGEASSLAEGVEFETEEDFRKKVETIKRSTSQEELEVAAATEPTEEASETPCRRNS